MAALFYWNRPRRISLRNKRVFLTAAILSIILPLLVLLPGIAWAAGIGDVITSVSGHFSQAEFNFGTEERTGLNIKLHAAYGGIAGGLGAVSVVGPMAPDQNPTVIKAVDLAAGSTGSKSVPIKGAQVTEYTMTDGVGLLVNLSDYIITVEIYESGKGNSWDFQTARKIAQETLDGLENAGILGRAAPQLTEQAAPEKKEQPEQKQETAAVPEAATAQPLDEPAVVSTTMNILAVYNGATAPATFSFDRPHLITQISDYHWNDAQGVTPGTIGFKDSSGKQYGPWQASGAQGQGGVPNAYWVVFPNIVVPAGTYTIIDSDPSTWSQNSESGGRGMSDVWGTPNFEVTGGSADVQAGGSGIPGTPGHGSGESTGGVGSVGSIPGPGSTTEAVVGVAVPGALATLLGALAGLGGGGGAPSGGIPFTPTSSGGSGGTGMPQTPSPRGAAGVEATSQLGRRRPGGSTVSGLGRKSPAGSGMKEQPDIYIDTADMHEGMPPVTSQDTGLTAGTQGAEGYPEIFIDTEEEMREVITGPGGGHPEIFIDTEEEMREVIAGQEVGQPDIFIEPEAEMQEVLAPEELQGDSTEIYIEPEEEAFRPGHPDIFIEPEVELQEPLSPEGVLIDTSGAEGVADGQGILFDGEAGSGAGQEPVRDEMPVFEEPSGSEEEIPVITAGLDKKGTQEPPGTVSGEQEPGVPESGQEGFDQDGYDVEGFDREGFDTEGFDRAGYDQEGFDREGYNQEGFDREGFNEYGFDEDGFNKEGFNEHGFDKQGFDSEGFNESGFDKQGYDREGFNDAGFDKEGFDSEGFNKEGFDAEGFDKEGFNREGFDQEGFNREGFDKQGYDREGFSQDGFDRSGFDRQGYDKQGYDREGFDQEGYNRRGFDEEGFDREGFDQKGFDKEGYNREGYDAKGYDRDGFEKDGFDKEGFDRNGYDREGFDREGYNLNGYDREGFDRDGFDAKGFDREGFDEEGFDAKGFDSDGFDRQGFDAKGFDKEGYNREGFDAKGFDREGYDKQGFDETGLDRDGFDRKGFDQEGFDREGFDRNGFDRDGFGRNGFDKNGYDREGYDINGYNQKGYDRSGYNAKGYDAQGYDREGFNKEGWDRDGYDRNGFNQAGYDREGYDKNGYDRDGYDREGFDKNGQQREGYDAEGYDKDGFNKNGVDRDGYDREGFDYEGYNRSGYDPWGYDKQGYGKDGYHWSGYNADGYNRDGRHWNENPFEEGSPFDVAIMEEGPFGEREVIPFGAKWTPVKPKLGEPYPRTVEKYGAKPWTNEPQIPEPEVSKPEIPEDSGVIGPEDPMNTLDKHDLGTGSGSGDGTVPEEGWPEDSGGIPGDAGDSNTFTYTDPVTGETSTYEYEPGYTGPRHGETRVLVGKGDGQPYELEFNAVTGKWINKESGNDFDPDAFDRWQREVAEGKEFSAKELEKMARGEDATSKAIKQTMDRWKQLEQMEKSARERGIGERGGPGDVEKAIQDMKNDILEGREFDQDKMDKVKKVIKNRIEGKTAADTGDRWEEIPWYEDIGSALKANAAMAKEVATGQKEDGSISWLGNLARLMIIGATGGAATTAGVVMDGGLTVAEAMLRIQEDIEKGETDFRAVAKAIGITILSEELSWLAGKTGEKVWGEMLERFPIFSNKLADLLETGALKIMKADQAGSAALGMINKEGAEETIDQINKRLADLAGDAGSEGLDQVTKTAGKGTSAAADVMAGTAGKGALEGTDDIASIGKGPGGKAGDLGKSVGSRPSVKPDDAGSTVGTGSGGGTDDLGRASGKSAVDGPEVPRKTGAGDGPSVTRKPSAGGGDDVPKGTGKTASGSSDDFTKGTQKPGPGSGDDLGKGTQKSAFDGDDISKGKVKTASGSGGKSPDGPDLPSRKPGVDAGGDGPDLPPRKPGADAGDGPDLPPRKPGTDGGGGGSDLPPRKPGGDAGDGPDLPPRKGGHGGDGPGEPGKRPSGGDDGPDGTPGKGTGAEDGAPRTGPVTSDIPAVNDYYVQPGRMGEVDNYAHINMDVERVRETMAKNYLQAGDSGAIYAAPPKAGVPAYEFTNTTTVRISKDHLVDVQIKPGPGGKMQYVNAQGQVIDPGRLRDKVLMTPAPEGTGVVLTYYDPQGNVRSYIPAKFLERWSNATNSFTPLG